MAVKKVTMSELVRLDSGIARTIHECLKCGAELPTGHPHTFCNACIGPDGLTLTLHRPDGPRFEFWIEPSSKQK